MIDPIYGSPGVSSAVAARPALGGPAGADQPSFASTLRAQLEEVSQLQSEADVNVQRILTGQSASVTEAFTAARKAEVAFSLLMEIRNKLVEAHQELQNLRV